MRDEQDSVETIEDRPATAPPPPSLPRADLQHAIVKARLFGAEIDQKIGRFRVIEKLGEGGMGIVYAAQDEELDRRVAIKLLRSEADGGQQRLHREARAMARVNHPNVVMLHDVGSYESGIYVAMEFIEGVSLRSWLSGDHDWRARLSVLRQAAKGLAAAHRVGLVHRDFKPDNVIVGDDGRARVLDFGLAKAASGDIDGSGLTIVDAHNTLTELTQSGVLIGTPAYMSPEQLRLEGTDARSDQFSFCVVLYEALYGERPFKGRSVAELAVAVADGRVEEPPADSPVPEAIGQAILRGLSPQRDDRFPSMQELHAALDPGAAPVPQQTPRIRPRLWLGVAAILAALSVAGWATYLFDDPDEVVEAAAVPVPATEDPHVASPEAPAPEHDAELEKTPPPKPLSTAEDLRAASLADLEEELVRAVKASVPPEAVDMLVVSYRDMLEEIEDDKHRKTLLIQIILSMRSFGPYEAPKLPGGQEADP